jgi:glycosyltransferase involved in cell wall biosynthesis
MAQAAPKQELCHTVQKPTQHALNVVALLAAYNEADVIEHVLSDLIAQGINVYFIDNHSTDSTVDIVRRYVGNGVIGLEQFPAGTDACNRFDWEGILKRKEILARDLDADWFIHQDADEFRESPWPGRRLVDAIAAVDRSGYNAIDFQVFPFWPTHNRFRPGDDVRQAFAYYAPGEIFNKLQVRCWKKTPSVDISSFGGHDARFSERRVFPIRFIVRHYPIRGQAHGERKVFIERRERFADSERARGWHIQYDGIRQGDSMLRSEESLVRFDPEAVRLHLLLQHRDVEELEAHARTVGEENEQLRADRVRERQLSETLGIELERLRTSELEHSHERQLLRTRLDAMEGDRRLAQAEIEGMAARIESLRAELAAAEESIAVARAERDTMAAGIEHLRAELNAATDRVSALLASASWRWTAPLRMVNRMLMRSER